jgi:hypothetical protein
MITEEPNSNESLPPQDVAEKSKPETKKKQKQWSFPTVSKCPRCGTTDTICARTDPKMGWQYRKCQRAICRHRYRVQGVKV